MQPQAAVRVVARTTSRSTTDASPSIDMRVTTPYHATGPYASQAIAVAVVGQIHSAFESRKAPGRVLVVSASQFLANPFARAGNPPPADPQKSAAQGDENLMLLAQSYAQTYITHTILAFKNTLDWAEANDDL